VALFFIPYALGLIYLLIINVDRLILNADSFSWEANDALNVVLRRIFWSLKDNDILRSILGEQDNHLKLIAKLAGVKMAIRGNIVTISGADSIKIQLTKRLILELYRLLEKGYNLYPEDINYAFRILSGDSALDLEKIFLIHIVTIVSFLL